MRLYKKDSKEKIRILNIYTDGAELIQESGLINGALVPHKKIAKGKNIGRSNETSPKEQAILEMNSKVAEKLTEGYFKTQQEAETEKVVLPMLAKDYKEEKDKIDWGKNVYIQPKLDGMRCLAHINGPGNIKLISRDGKIIEGLEHIKKELATIAENVILDGELYAHGLSFQENMKLIKKYRPNETEKIKFHVYDRVEEEIFEARNAKNYLLLVDFTTCELVPTSPLYENTLSESHSLNISHGYEGSIIRHGDTPYKANVRSSNLLKYKDFIDIAIPIKDIEPADQRPEWGTPVFEWKGAKKDELRAGMKYSHEEREEFLMNKANYIGKTAEIRFFEYSDEGVPRFPVMIGIRLDK